MEVNVEKKLEELSMAHRELEAVFMRHTGPRGVMVPDEFEEFANRNIDKIINANIPNYRTSLSFLVAKKEKPYWEKEKLTDSFDDYFEYSVDENGMPVQERRVRTQENRCNRLLGVEVVNVRSGHAVMYKHSEEPERGLLLPQKLDIRVLFNRHFLGYPKVDD